MFKLKIVSFITLLIALASCDSEVSQEVNNTLDKGKEIEVVSSIDNQTSIRHNSEFTKFQFNPDRYSFDEIDTYYRKHWSMQEGVDMNHNNHNIALQTIAEQYNLANQSIDRIEYYVAEMNQLDWMMETLIPYYIDAVQSITPKIGEEAARAMLQKRHENNLSSVARFQDVNPDFMVQYKPKNDLLLQ